jgi:hypothetical protein
VFVDNVGCDFTFGWLAIVGDLRGEIGTENGVAMGGLMVSSFLVSETLLSVLVLLLEPIVPFKAFLFPSEIAEDMPVRNQS